MAFGSSSRIPGLAAAADLSTKQFYVVEMTATGVNLCGDGEVAIGILQNKPLALGDAAEVQGLDSQPSKAVAGAAIAKGATVASDANGKVVTAASGDYIIGQALEAASADGDIITVLLTGPGRLA